MKFEVIESGEEWVVQSEGVELARYAAQAQALQAVAARLREAEPGEAAVSLRMRFQPRD